MKSYSDHHLLSYQSVTPSVRPTHCSQVIQHLTFLIPDREMSSSQSHPMFWSQPNHSLSSGRASDPICWSYPPPKRHFCAKLLTQMSAKLSELSANSKSFHNPLRHQNIEELLSSQVLRRMSAKEGILHAFEDLCCGSDCDTSSATDRTVFECEDMTLDTICDSISVDSSDEKSAKMQINDKKVLNSMQNDRQKRIKRKRRRRKKKTPSKMSSNCSPNKCYNADSSDDSDDDYDSNSDTISEISVCFELGSDLELMCRNVLFNCYFTATHLLTADEVDSCHRTTEPSTAVSETIRAADEADESSDESEELIGCEEKSREMKETLRKVNETWDQNNGDVSAEDHESARVRFSTQRPAVRVLRVWTFASWAARRGHWEEMARDRDRFVKKCQKIEAKIGSVLSAEHRQRVFESRFESYLNNDK